MPHALLCRRLTVEGGFRISDALVIALLPDADEYFSDDREFFSR
jgi:hypothetical protein